MRRKCWALFILLLGAASALSEEVNDAAPVTRIAFGSCNKEHKPQPLWKPILECQPDVWIWLGDIVYGDANDLADLARRYSAEKEQPEYKTLRSKSRVLGIWDDADFGEGNGGKENSHKAESQRLLLDFLDEPPESSRRRQAGVYTAYTLGPPGKQVKIILLDGRFHREHPARFWEGLWGSHGDSADILGAQQWAWLEQQLTESSADVHLIGSGIQVIASEHRYEKWADFPKARGRLLDLIAKTKARNVVFLSGDRHLGEISRLTDPRISQPIYDVTSSGMTHHAANKLFRNFSDEPNQFRRGRNFLDLNFGLIEIAWEASPSIVTMQIRGADNGIAIEEKMTMAPAHPADR